MSSLWFMARRAVRRHQSVEAAGAVLDIHPDSPGQMFRRRPGVPCRSFCGKYRPECTGLAATQPGARASQTAAVCGECLMLCAEIFAERNS
jgi:ClpX C4-type zinc finger